MGSIVALTTEIRALTEAFYYFAARLRYILRSEHLPGLSIEAVGVRNVRNHLIEHSEKKPSRVTAQSFEYGGPKGPVIKGSRPAATPDVFPDAGLYLNAEELRVELERVLSAVVSDEPVNRG